MATLGDSTYRVDLLKPLSLGVHIWIIILGLWSTFAVAFANEFFSIHVGYFLSLIIGVPLSIFMALCCATFLFFFKKIQGPPTYHPMSPADFAAARKKIARAWIVGCIATITALFAHYNPGGNGQDFSPINIMDALITASLTYGFFKQKLWSALLLLGYFVFWKMILWPYNQPRAISFAGIIMAIFLWQGIVGIILLRRKKT